MKRTDKDIEKTLKNIEATLAIESMRMTEEEKAAGREILSGKKNADAVLQEHLKKVKVG